MYISVNLCYFLAAIIWLIAICIIARLIVKDYLVTSFIIAAVLGCILVLYFGIANYQYASYEASYEAYVQATAPYRARIMEEMAKNPHVGQSLEDIVNKLRPHHWYEVHAYLPYLELRQKKCLIYAASIWIGGLVTACIFDIDSTLYTFFQIPKDGHGWGWAPPKKK